MAYRYLESISIPENKFKDKLIENGFKNIATLKHPNTGESRLDGELYLTHQNVPGLRKYENNKVYGDSLSALLKDNPDYKVTQDGDLFYLYKREEKTK